MTLCSLKKLLTAGYRFQTKISGIWWSDVASGFGLAMPRLLGIQSCKGEGGENLKCVWYSVYSQIIIQFWARSIPHPSESHMNVGHFPLGDGCLITLMLKIAVFTMDLCKTFCLWKAKWNEFICYHLVANENTCAIQKT